MMHELYDSNFVESRDSFRSNSLESDHIEEKPRLNFKNINIEGSSE